MSSERLPPTIDFIVGASPSLACICAAAHAAAITAVVLSGVVWSIRIVAILALLGFAAWWIAARALALAPDSIVRFIWRPDGECEWQERRGRWRRGSLAPGSLALPTLVVLRLRDGRRLHMLCLARDGANGEDLRRLRVRLNVSPPFAPPSPVRRLAGALRHRLTENFRPDGFALKWRRRADR